MGGGTGLLVGASPWWYPATLFCYSCPHPEGSSVGGTLDVGEVTEVSCWTGQSLLALKALGGFQDQAQRSGVAGAVQGTGQVGPGLYPFGKVCPGRTLNPSSPCPSISWRGDPSSLTPGLYPGSTGQCELPESRVKD